MSRGNIEGNDVKSGARAWFPFDVLLAAGSAADRSSALPKDGDVALRSATKGVHGTRASPSAHDQRPTRPGSASRSIGNGAKVDLVDLVDLGRQKGVRLRLCWDLTEWQIQKRVDVVFGGGRMTQKE